MSAISRSVDNRTHINRRCEASNTLNDYAPKEETVFLSGGLTLAHGELVQAALRGMGYRFISLDEPDFESFRLGKIYGNKAQCNPTYFTVGNLIKYLTHLRDEEKMPTEEIIRRYVYITAGGCGPCRFGMYVTEYKKALRDAGFEGFRITSFDHEKGIFQGEDADGLIDYTPAFFIRLAKAVLVGDVLNLIGYQIRPYERTAGETDRVLARCRRDVAKSFERNRALLPVLWRCRRTLQGIARDTSLRKPRVMVIGEFWASLTEGDGSYGLYRFLESEGAECIPQPIVNRLLLNIWDAKYAAMQRAALPGEKAVDFSPLKTRALIAAADKAVRWHFALYARILGLTRYRLPDMDKLADLAKGYYNLECNGGEGHLEVAHLLEAVKEDLADLVISVKPFGCMPSSGVSDGVQSLVTARYPEANFLAIETSGEGAANFYSRVQMALFKAKEKMK